MRRIFPALFTVFGFCIAVAFFLSLPLEAKAIGESIISSIFFVSNILFYSQSGYFDRNMETNPILHTWSLSVEEQFYVIFPIIIYLIRNFNDKLKIRILFAIALSSFLSCVWMVRFHPQAAFYLVQFRAWELLIGSLLAVNAVPKLIHQWQAELVGAGGLALIIGSTMLISFNTPFPGVAALAPSFGAAAVIHSGTATTTLTGRLLALSPIRFIGLISYSLYLWHWPAIVFYRLFVDEPGKIEKGALVAVCILLATVSWRLIEKPFRAKPYRLGAYRTLLAGGAVMISASVAAIALSPLIEKVWTYPGRATEVLSYEKVDFSHMRVETCFLISSSLISSSSHDNEFHYRNECLAVKPGLLDFLILGDSYAAHLWPGLQTLYPGINFLQASVGGCVPIIGAETEDPLCSGMMKYITEEFLPRTHLNGIIISARWKSDDIPAAIKTAQALLPYADRVILFGPIVQYNQALPRILARAIASNKSESKLAEIHRLATQLELDRSFAAALQDGPVEYVSVYRALCDPACEIWAARNVPLQFDDGHLTREGSIELARKVGPQLFPDSTLPSAFRAMGRHG
jgi:peptidoglycan/LPS O-acetylase OafA/YrhL